MSQEEWQYISRELQKEWEHIPLGHSRPWEEIQDDVRFGWEQAMRPEFDGAQWEDVDSEIQRRWEQSYPHADYEDWRTVSEAIRLGFNRAKGRVI